VTQEQLIRDLETKKRELRLAGQKYGAIVNGKRRDVSPVAAAGELEKAARALVRAEQALEDFDIARRASGLCTAEAV
jgi:hypothetical protein